MGSLYMRIGPNFGNLLLEMAQTKIQKGTPEKAISLYTEALHGFTEEYAMMLLTNKAVLVTDDSGTNVELVDSQDALKDNEAHIFDWPYMVKSAVKNIDELRDGIYVCENEFDKVSDCDINDVCLAEIVNAYFGDEYSSVIGIHNIAAKLIAGDKFATELKSNGEAVWENLCDKVEREAAEKYEIALYMIVRYVDGIRELHKEYVRLAKMYRFLRDHSMVPHYPFIEQTFETTLRILTKFNSPNKGYHHPMCDEKLFAEKERMDGELLTTYWGKEFRRYKILEKNLLDGYDAGYLSPEGTFYSALGPTSSMIHLNLAEELFKGRLSVPMLKDGVTLMGSLSPEHWLDRKGYLKIHHNEVYGAFFGTKDDDDDFPYCPTEAQVKAICDYADKNWNGKILTQPQVVHTTEPVSTYKLRQMDEFKLHEIFHKHLYFLKQYNYERSNITDSRWEED
ncbi:MAG: hypothetical protein IJ640_00470 [Prevotella sp.]|nr:hypothetical protein [Prevotella sp.]